MALVLSCLRAQLIPFEHTTLVGEPSLINIAQSYLKQIDLRKRQVAVKVQLNDS